MIFPLVMVVRSPTNPALPGKHHFIIRTTSRDPGVQSRRGYPTEKAARLAGERYAEKLK